MNFITREHALKCRHAARRLPMRLLLPLLLLLLLPLLLLLLLI